MQNRMEGTVMNHVRLTPGSILQERLNQVHRRLYRSMDPENISLAYGGVHPLGFAEPEFAGKYLDISAAYARNLADAQAVQNGRTVVERLVSGQRADGYLGGYDCGQEFSSFSIWNQAFTCFGLISYYKETRDEDALAAAVRCMDFLCESCQAADAKPFLQTGNFGSQHLVVLLPAALLYELTGEARYQAFCRFILDVCRRSPTHNIFARAGVMGFGSPKGIETLAFLLGVLTYGRLTGDEECIDAARAYWQDLQEHFISETGCGTVGELWTYQRNQPAMLSREIKPNENCVAVGWMELSLMLYDLTLDGRYFDAFERALYNHLLGSMAPDGSDFAYYQGNFGRKSIRTSEGLYACCRFRGLSMCAHLPECAVFVRGNTLSFPFYTSYCAEVSTPEGDVHIEMSTEYPRNGRVRLLIRPQRQQSLRLLLRLPAWCDRYAATLDGETTELPLTNGHLLIERSIPADGLRICLDLNMPIRTRTASLDETQCACVEYGPLVMALDSRNGTPIFSTTLDGDSVIRLLPAEEGGMPIVSLEASGSVRGEDRAIRLVDYASAGMHNPLKDRFRVWIPLTGEDLEGLY